VNGPPLNQLCEVAKQAARAAGEYIQSVDRDTLRQSYKPAGSSAASQMVTEVDVRCEALIRDALQPLSRQWNIAFVGEESAQDEPPERLTKPYFWCVDPLDGTLPFVEGRQGYAVSIALLEQDGTPLIGVVCEPTDATLTYAIQGQGAFRNGAPLKAETDNATSLTVLADNSFTDHPRYTEAVQALTACAQHLELEGVTLTYGSGAVKNACQVLEHGAACYLKLPKSEEGGGSIWDFAATALIVREAGGWASNMCGDALALNRPGSTFMNEQGVVYASTAVIAKHLIKTLSGELP